MTGRPGLERSQRKRGKEGEGKKFKEIQRNSFLAKKQGMKDFFTDSFIKKKKRKRAPPPRLRGGRKCVHKERGGKGKRNDCIVMW